MALIRIDLTEQLGEGQYVEISDPKLIPWGKRRELSATLKDESMESKLSFQEALTIKFVKNGNVFDEDGNAVSFPITEETVVNVPAVVLDEVAIKFAELSKKKEEGEVVPKK